MSFSAWAMTAELLIIKTALSVGFIVRSRTCVAVPGSGMGGQTDRFFPETSPCSPVVKRHFWKNGSNNTSEIEASVLPSTLVCGVTVTSF